MKYDLTFDEFLKEMSIENIIQYNIEKNLESNNEEFYMHIYEYIEDMHNGYIYFDEDDNILGDNDLIKTRYTFHKKEEIMGWDVFEDDQAETIYEKDKIQIHKWFKDYIESIIEDIHEHIIDNISECKTKIKLKRGMNINISDINEDSYIHTINDNNEYNALGICWSVNAEVANEFNSGTNTKLQESIYLEAEVDLKDINWLKTINLMLHPHLKTEQEFRLFNHSIIEIKNITINKIQKDIKRHFFIANKKINKIHDINIMKNESKEMSILKLEDKIKQNLQRIKVLNGHRASNKTKRNITTKLV